MLHSCLVQMSHTSIKPIRFSSRTIPFRHPHRRVVRNSVSTRNHIWWFDTSLRVSRKLPVYRTQNVRTNRNVSNLPCGVHRDVIVGHGCVVVGGDTRGRHCRYDVGLTLKRIGGMLFNYWHNTSNARVGGVWVGLVGKRTQRRWWSLYFEANTHFHSWNIDVPTFYVARSTHLEQWRKFPNSEFSKIWIF